MSDATRVCRKCGLEKPTQAFSPTKRWCKPCINASNNASRRLRRADPTYRRNEYARERRRIRRKAYREGRLGPQRSACERCHRDFEYVKNSGDKGLRVCRPCRRVDWAWSKFGLHSVSLPTFYEEHGSCCGICGVANGPSRWTGHDGLVIDHDHETGELRGLLCSPCNNAIGLLGDDPERIRAAANYVAIYRRPNRQLRLPER